MLNKEAEAEELGRGIRDTEEAIAVSDGGQKRVVLARGERLRDWRPVALSLETGETGCRLYSGSL